MTIKTLSKLAIVAAIPLVVGQAQANTATKAAAKLVKPKAKVTSPKTTAVNPAASLRGVMSVSRAENILSQSTSGSKLVSFLNSAKAESKFAAQEIAIIKEAAARNLLKVKATTECLSGLQSDVSQRRYVKIVNSALAVLQSHGIGFNSAIKSESILVEVSSALTNELASLQGIKSADLAIERTGTVVGVCSIRGEANPVPKAEAVKANFVPAL